MSGQTDVMTRCQPALIASSQSNPCNASIFTSAMYVAVVQSTSVRCVDTKQLTKPTLLFISEFTQAANYSAAHTVHTELPTALYGNVTPDRYTKVS